MTSPVEQGALQVAADAAAWLASCRRRSVGAAVFTLSGAYVASGYNGGTGTVTCLEGACPRGLRTREEVPSYEDGPTNYTSGPGRCVFPHAEKVAEDRAKAREFDLGQCLLAVTNKPCDDCMNRLEAGELASVIWPGGRWDRNRRDLMRDYASPHAYVEEFHRTYGVVVRTNPIADPPESDLRTKLLKEEVEEYYDAVTEGDVVEVADALADIVYVAYGAALIHGIDLDAVLEEVHRSNMSKLGADGNPVYRDDGKVIKGPNYFPPNLAPILGVDR